MKWKRCLCNNTCVRHQKGVREEKFKIRFTVNLSPGNFHSAIMVGCIYMTNKHVTIRESL